MSNININHRNDRDTSSVTSYSTSSGNPNNRPGSESPAIVQQDACPTDTAIGEDENLLSGRTQDELLAAEALIELSIIERVFR